MPLPEERRRQLDEIVMQMGEQDAPQADVDIIVNDFIAKYQGESVPTVQQPKKSALEKTGNALTSVFGGRQIGEAIGTQLAKIIVPKEQEKYIEKGPSAKRVIADVANVGLNLATAGGAGMAGKLGVKVAKTAALGAGLGATKAVADNQEVGKEALTGGVVGAALPVVGAGLSQVGKALLIKTPRQLVNFALKVPTKQAGREVNEAFLSRKLGGKSLEEIVRVSQKEATDVDKIIQSKLTDKNLVKNVDFVTDLASSLKTKSGATIKPEDLRRRISNFIPDHADLVLKDSLTQKEANLLRRAIDGNLKEATFLGKELSNEQKAIKMYANKLRALVQRDSATEALFKQQSEAIAINKLAKQAMDKAETQGKPGLLDITSAGVGFGGGGIPGAIAGVVAQRALRSSRVQSGTAQILRKLAPVAPALEKLAAPERLLIINSILDLYESDPDDDQQ